MQKNMTNPPSLQARRHTQAAGAICALLFATFSIAYLYLLHGDVLQALHASLSEGKTTYSPLGGAVMLTVVIMAVRWGLNLLTRFRHRWMALSYFPAYLSLVILTGVSPGTDAESGTFALRPYPGLWGWVIVALILYTALALFYRRHIVRGTVRGLLPVMLTALPVMTGFTLFTGFAGNNGQLFHHELSLAQSIRGGHPEQVFVTGRKSLHSSRTLSALRTYALSLTDSLGSRLFTFPLSDRAESLFFDESEGAVSPVTNADICAHLGGTPRRDRETATRYLMRLCRTTGGRASLDYYLCALLLDRQLEPFIRTLDEYYDGEPSALPRHYQEALSLYRRQHHIETLTPPGEGPLHTDSLAVSPAIATRHQAFTDLQHRHQREAHRANYTRRTFGDTYWWYFWYGE